MKIGVLTGCIILVAALATQAQVRIETTVEDFVTTKFIIHCPPYNGKPAVTLNVDELEKLSDKDVDDFFAAVSKFESQNGIQITSNTAVEDFVTTSDRIDSKSVGRLDEAGRCLCDLVHKLLEQQEAPNVPVAAYPLVAPAPNKMIIKTRVVNLDGSNVGIFINCPDCGNGNPFVFTQDMLPRLNERQQQQAFDLMKQIEDKYGMHARNQSKVENGITVNDLVETTATAPNDDPLVKRLCMILQRASHR